MAVDNSEVLGEIELVYDTLIGVSNDTSDKIAALSNGVYPELAAHSSSLVGLGNGVAALSNYAYPAIAAHSNAIVGHGTKIAALSNVLYPLDTYARERALELQDQITAGFIGLSQSVYLTEVKPVHNGAGRAPHITFSNANLVPLDPPAGSPASSQSIGDATARWNEGRFVSLYADNFITTGNFTATDANGVTRRALLEGELTVPTALSQLTNDLPPSTLQGPKGADGKDGTNGTNGAAGPPGTTLWGGLTDKPAWTNNFTWCNVGSYMDPVVAENYDITALNSITPAPGNPGYNLGQDKLRWLYVYARLVKSSDGIIFGNNASPFTGQYSELAGVPTVFPSAWAQVSGKPGWAKDSAADIPLSAFLGTASNILPVANNAHTLGSADAQWSKLYTAGIQFGTNTAAFTGSYNELRDKPTLTAAWADVTGKPAWTGLLSYSNIGPSVYPAVELNYDIVTSDSVTPVADGAYNLGQHLLRYRSVYAKYLHAQSGVLFNGAFTGAFTGSYNELRDLPDLQRSQNSEIDTWLAGSLHRALFAVGVTRDSYQRVKARLMYGAVPGYNATGPTLSELTVTVTLYEAFGTDGYRRERATHTATGTCSSAATGGGGEVTWYHNGVGTPLTTPQLDISANILVVSLQGQCTHGAVTRALPLGCTAPVLVSSLAYNTEVTMYVTPV